MSDPEREIPQRELRNHISRILAEVASGHRVRVTVSGRPVADLVPVGTGRRFVPRREVERLIHDAPLDAGFVEELDAVAGATIEEL
jgi:prevent-host-death family protein